MATRRGLGLPTRSCATSLDLPASFWVHTANFHLTSLGCGRAQPILISECRSLYLRAWATFVAKYPEGEQPTSKLALASGDDHPEAAAKHLADAAALMAAARPDGAAYLSGYVVERGLKDRISTDYVQDLLTELPWLQSVLDVPRPDALVPYIERDLVRRLEGFQGQRAPPYSGKDLVEYLIELAVLRRRPEGRIDAPDLHGLGLRRKGGVSRKR